MMKTFAEAMAIAVLKGDMVAACALADKLIEERTQAESLPIVTPLGRPVDGFEVYHWPEFRAFAERLGFKYDLATIDVTISIRQGEFVKIEHNYQAREPTGHDNG